MRPLDARWEHVKTHMQISSNSGPWNHEVRILPTAHHATQKWYWQCFNTWPWNGKQFKIRESNQKVFGDFVTSLYIDPNLIIIPIIRKSVILYDSQPRRPDRADCTSYSNDAFFHDNEICAIQISAQTASYFDTLLRASPNSEPVRRLWLKQ